MFISRLTRDPYDIHIFGRALAEPHVPGRDEASEAEIAERPWKVDWRNYVRVHDAEFIAGPLANGIPLSALMDALEHDAFASTQRNHLSGSGNVVARHAYSQQPAVELTPAGMAWLNARFDQALARHGRIPTATLDAIGWG